MLISSFSIGRERIDCLGNDFRRTVDEESFATVDACAKEFLCIWIKKNLTVSLGSSSYRFNKTIVFPESHFIVQIDQRNLLIECSNPLQQSCAVSASSFHLRHNLSTFLPHDSILMVTVDDCYNEKFIGITMFRWFRSFSFLFVNF